MTEEIEYGTLQMVASDTETQTLMKREVMFDPSDSLLNRLLSVFVKNSMDLDVITKFVELSEKVEKNEARKAFYKDFSEFKKETIEIVKGKKAGFDSKDGKSRTSYSYASEGDISAEISHKMGLHGLSYFYRVTQNSNVITVTCIVAHALGHCEETSLSAQSDITGNKNAIQAIGSAITYLKKYTLLAAAGVGTMDDDDGKSAKGFSDPPARKKKDTAELDPLSKWTDEADRNSKTEAQLNAWLKGSQKRLIAAGEKMKADVEAYVWQLADAMFPKKNDGIPMVSCPLAHGQQIPSSDCDGQSCQQNCSSWPKKNKLSIED